MLTLQEEDEEEEGEEEVGRAAGEEKYNNDDNEEEEVRQHDENHADVKKEEAEEERKRRADRVYLGHPCIPPRWPPPLAASSSLSSRSIPPSPHIVHPLAGVQHAAFFPGYSCWLGC